MPAREAEFAVSEEPLPGGIHMVSVQGEIDAATVPRLEETLMRAAASGVSRLVLDLRRVAYIDSLGFTVLARALDELKARRGKLAVVCDAQLAGLFEALDLDTEFHVTADIDTGLKSALQQKTQTSLPAIDPEQPWQAPLRAARELIESGRVPPDDEDLLALRLTLDESAGGEP